jgi:hypothetical protein
MEESNNRKHCSLLQDRELITCVKSFMKPAPERKFEWIQ